MHEDFPEIPSGLLDRWHGLLRNYADLLHLSVARVLRLQHGVWHLMSAAGPAADRLENGPVVTQEPPFAGELVVAQRLVCRESLSDVTFILKHQDRKHIAQSYVGIPVYWPSGSLFGVLDALNDAPREFTDAERRLLVQIRDDIEDHLVLLHGNRADLVTNHETRERLQASEERFRLLVENAGDDYFLHDDQGRFIDVNERACRSLGYSQAELLTMEVGDVAFGVTADQRHQLFRDASPGSSQVVKSHHRRKDGSMFPVEVVITCVEIDGRKLFMGLARDITERERAERMVREVNADLERRVALRTAELQDLSGKLQGVLNSAADIIFVKDLGGRYLLFNPAGERFLGRSADEVIGCTDSDLFPPEMAAVFMRATQQVLQAQDSLTLEEKVLSAQGVRTMLTTRSPLRDEHGRIHAVMGVAHDITERKQVELELQLQRQRMALAIDVGALGVLDVNLDTDAVLCNAQGLEILGLQGGDGLALGLVNRLIHVQDRTAWDNHLNEVRSGAGPQRVQLRVVQPDGAVRWVSAAARFVAGQGQVSDRLVCVMVDVTESHQAERKLKNSFESLQQAERLSRMGSWTLDIQRQVFAVSDMLREIVGFSCDEEVSLSRLTSVMSEENYQKVKAGLEDCVANGSAFTMAFEHYRTDGSTFAAEVRAQGIRDDSGQVVSVTGTVQDVSEREEARAQLASLADRLPSGALYQLSYVNPELGLAGPVDGGDLHLNYISGGIEALIGISAQQLQENPGLLFNAVHEEDRAPFLSASRDASATHSLFECDFRLRRPDGSLIWLRIRSAPRKVKGGWIWDGIILDITRQHEVESALRQAKDAAERAERAKADFLANMSHEIRTPMNSVLGMTRLALQTDLSPRQKNYLEKIDISTRALLAIINDILDFSKIEAGGFELDDTDFALEQVLEAVSNATSLRADEKGLEVVYAIAPDVPRAFRGDPLRLSQVLINLVGNAVKFTDAGEVVVSANVLESREDGSDLVQFSVRDTGIGLSQEALGRLFVPFHQADGGISRRYGGTGLGLTICKQLVEKMSGGIRAESEPGRGSLFSFTVALGLPSSDMALRAKSLHGYRVLVVDDNATSRESLGGMISSFGMQADCVDSGLHALARIEAVAQEGKSYDLVLMDWQMPEMDGIEATRRIRQERGQEHVPAVLMVTAYGRDEILNQVTSADLQGILVKPVTESVMFDTVQDVLAGPRMHAQHFSTSRQVRSVLTPSMRRMLNGKQVLVVDDNALNLEVATDFLVLAGVQVDTAVNGLQAIRLLEMKAYDAVLMDMHMPEMDGVTATREIRRNPAWQALPIIALTAQARTEDREATIRAGMTPHLSKPIEEHLLYQTLVDIFTGDHSHVGKLARSQGSGGEIVSIRHALSQQGPVDFDAALHRMGDNPERMRRLLHGFLRDFADVPQRLDAAVAAQDHKNLEALAHLVKGAAGYVQAKALTHSADALERQAGRGDAAAMERLAFTFRADLTAVLEAISDRLRRLADAAAKQFQPVAGTDAQKTLALIDKAEPLMRRGDYAATALLTDLAHELQGHPASAKLEEARVLYEDIELIDALTAMGQLRQLLGLAKDAAVEDQG
ncbi:PAS domain S-box protein [Comamonas odontotermitis]|uniref:PAS domain S-box protein n=1 Tax=Comamonas odontotermitis TaxID=379895 RepID=UPI00366D5EE9